MSKPSFSIPFESIKSCVHDDIRPNCIRLDALGSRKILICFKTYHELKLWRNDLDLCLHPVLLIGEHDDKLGLGADVAREHCKLSGSKALQDTSTVSSSTSLSEQLARHTSEEFAATDVSTLFDSSSHETSSYQQSIFSGTTLYTERHSSWDSSTPWISDNLSEILSALDNNEASKPEVADDRPSSPIDPELVFESGSAHLSVSEYPASREVSLDLADLTGQIAKLDTYPVAVGGFADVWRGEWDTPDGFKLVSICLCSLCFVLFIID